MPMPFIADCANGVGRRGGRSAAAQSQETSLERKGCLHDRLARQRSLDLRRYCCRMVQVRRMRMAEPRMLAGRFHPLGCAWVQDASTVQQHP